MGSDTYDGPLRVMFATTGISRKYGPIGRAQLISHLMGSRAKRVTRNEFTLNSIKWPRFAQIYKSGFVREATFAPKCAPYGHS